jgi:hypothetical protein
VPAAGQKADTVGVTPHHEPIAVLLYLMQPVRPGGRARGIGWKAGLDEEWGGAQTRQHSRHIGATSSKGEPSAAAGLFDLLGLKKVPTDLAAVAVVAQGLLLSSGLPPNITQVGTSKDSACDMKTRPEGIIRAGSP